MSTCPRLLVLRALGLGDLLAGVPALRQGFPDHEPVPAAPAELTPVRRATVRRIALLTAWLRRPCRTP